MTLSLDFYAAFAATNNWLAILPEIGLAVLGLLVLIADLLLPASQRAWLPRLVALGQLLILAFVATAAMSPAAATVGADGTLFGGLLAPGANTELLRIFFVLTSLLICHLGTVFLTRRGLPQTEFYAIVLITTAALMLLVQASDLIMLFVALETVTVGFYVLVAYYRENARCLEGGLKYLILGAFSSGLMLFGIVLLYGVASDPELATTTVASPTSFAALQSFLAVHASHPLALAGAGLVLAGLAFKIGAVPFHIWVPDVYQGAPTPTTAFLAVGSKAGGFFVLLNLLTGPFAPLKEALLPIIAILSALSIIYGNLAAIGQKNVKRLMGLSGIAHAGYLLMGLAAAYTVAWAGQAVILYLFAYYLGAFAVFYVMTHAAPENDTDQLLTHYKDLAQRNPFLAVVLVAGLGSLAGIPPLAGFFAKLILFIAAYQAALYWLVAIAIIGVVISICYYFNWIMEAVYRPKQRPLAEREIRGVSLSARLVMGLLAGLAVVAGFYQGLLTFIL